MVAPISLGHSERVHVEAGTLVRGGDRNYSLKSSLDIDVFDWRGANAGLYIIDPLRGGKTVIERPALEDGDIRQATLEVLGRDASRYSSLRGMPAEKVKGDDRKDLDYLATVFEDAQAVH